MSKRKTSLLAATAYAVFFLPLLSKPRKDSFARFHARQGFVLLVVALALQGMLSLWVWGGVPGWALLRGLIRAFLLVEATIGVLNAMRGEEKPLPAIGKYAPEI